MLNVGRIEEGFVLDHIKAGKSMTIYHDLKLDKLDCCVAIIKNARSNKMGKKDIIKVECSVDMLDLDILGFIDHNITVNIIGSNVLPDTFGGRLSAPIICFTLFCMEKGNSSIRRKSMSFLPAMPF